jgi:hypothetical protein
MKRSLAVSCLFLAMTVAAAAYADDAHDKGGDKSPPAAKVAAP